MFAPLPTPSEMSLWDQAAVALGLPELLLMENASREALHVLTALRPDLKGQKILVFMGGGNNGGDAVCLARHLLDAGARVVVVHTRPAAAYRGVTAQHLRLARRCGLRLVPAASWPDRFRRNADLAPWLQPDVVIDGLLGTGFSGQLRPLERRLVRDVNNLRDKAFVLALDIPSGLSGLTGRACPEAVRAHATVTFEAAKPGLVLPEAAPYVGNLHVRAIGIPAPARAAHPASFRLLGPEAVLPQPETCRHKGTAGHVLVAGGSTGLTGAPHLTAQAALRSGAGLVTAAAPDAVCAAIKAGDPNIMTLPLTERSDNRQWTPELLPALLPALRRCNALALGPGLGRAASAAAFVGGLLALEDRPPSVIDADALHALALNPQWLTLLRPEDVLTPHPGEAAFLLGLHAADVQADRFTALIRLMESAPAVWVLKGEGTLIGRQGEPVTISPYAEPNLAVGGSGDVLTGCVAALLAQGLDSLSAACTGVLLHGEAGRLLSRSYPQRGNTASDIAAALPRAGAELAGQSVRH